MGFKGATQEARCPIGLSTRFSRAATQSARLGRSYLYFRTRREVRVRVPELAPKCPCNQYGRVPGLYTEVERGGRDRERDLMSALPEGIYIYQVQRSVARFQRFDHRLV